MKEAHAAVAATLHSLHQWANDPWHIALLVLAAIILIACIPLFLGIMYSRCFKVFPFFSDREIREEKVQETMDPIVDEISVALTAEEAAWKVYEKLMKERKRLEAQAWWHFFTAKLFRHEVREPKAAEQEAA